MPLRRARLSGNHQSQIGCIPPSKSAATGARNCGQAADEPDYPKNSFLGIRTSAKPCDQPLTVIAASEILSSQSPCLVAQDEYKSRCVA
jgi:hypothetical protein